MKEPQSTQDVIKAHFAESAEIKRRTAAGCAADIERAAVLIAAAFNTNHKLLICGNGGSAADSQHMAAELIGHLTVGFDRPGLPAIALTTDTSVLTSYANDFDFEGVFARQVQALGQAGDVLLGISTSGSSKNIVKAVEQARLIGLAVIAFTAEEGVLPEIADVAVRIPSTVTAHIQEAHLCVEHIVCHLVERMVGYGVAR